MVAPLRCTAACKYPHERYVRGGCPSRVDERRSLAAPSVTPDCSCCRAALTLLDLYYIHLDGGAGSKWMSNNAMRGGYLLRSPWQIAPNGNGTRNPMPIDGQATSTRGGRTLDSNVQIETESNSSLGISLIATRTRRHTSAPCSPPLFLLHVGRTGRRRRRRREPSPHLPD